jgi:hypothetical protein
LNKQLREGFVRDDEADATEAKVIEHMPARAPVVEPAKATPEAEAPPPFDPNKADVEEVVWPLHLKLLRKPTRNMKNEIIHELEIRAPTAKDIRQCGGNPVRYDSDFNVITDNDRMMQMVALLSGLHLPMVDQLDGRDWVSISFYMQRFFLPDSRTWVPLTLS